MTIKRLEIIFKKMNKGKVGLLVLLFISILISGIVRGFLYDRLAPYSISGDSETYTTEFKADFRRGEVDNFRTPVYPLFAKIIKITSNSETEWFENIASAQRLLFAASIAVMFFALNKFIRNKPLVAIASILYGCCPALVTWNGFILTESLSVFEFSLLFYCTVNMIKSKALRYDLLSGILIGVMILTRPAAIFLLGVYGLYWLIRIFQNKKNRKQYIFKALAGASSLVIVFIYCSMMLYQHGVFGLSSVSRLNKDCLLVASGLYSKSEDVEKNKIIRESIDGGYDAFFAITDLKKRYSVSEVEAYLDDIDEKVSIFDYIPYYVRKIILYSNKWMCSFYESPGYEVAQAIYLVFPISFGVAFWVVAIGIIVAIRDIFRHGRFDWIMCCLVAIASGSLFLAFVGAPYEVERLSLFASICVILILTYLADKCLTKGKR